MYFHFLYRVPTCNNLPIVINETVIPNVFVWILSGTEIWGCARRQIRIGGIPPLFLDCTSCGRCYRCRLSRGFELGTFDTGLLLVSLKTQAEKWHDFALGYISDVITFVHHFIVKVLHRVSPSDRVRNGIIGLLTTSLEKKYRKAMDHTRFLLDVELNGTTATHNHYFNEVLQKRRQERHSRRLEGRSFNDCTHGHVIRMDDLIATHPLNNADHTVTEIHDILNSYYKVARKRFVDSVRMQVADHHLVIGPETPLALFSAVFVSAMSTEQLEEVAGEDVSVRRQRSNLEKEIEKLRESKGILK
ncbi:hypothetical protein GQ44DRAFT_694830 [Phaeosphaeriaceae sp. PMI808]|nr:hypothetical protein GQ44DRAFT_694830 [Phaeosphaeriaceae sp. PMI808]